MFSKIDWTYQWNYFGFTKQNLGQCVLCFVSWFGFILPDHLTRPLTHNTFHAYDSENDNFISSK